MKKIAFILLSACIVFSSCKNDSIRYKGPDVINIVLQERYNIDADSKEPIVYSSDNNLIVDIVGDGTILGKNVGEANVTLSSESDDLSIPVIVSLFEEPSFNFHCSPSYIKDLYDEPRIETDSVFVYGGSEDWYSFAVWEMDFFFKNKQYIEADLYIRKDLEIRVDEYLNSNFFYRNKVKDEDTNITYDIYLNNENPENATVLVGKIKDAGPYKDICLFYIPYEHQRNSDYNDIFSRNRR